MSNQLSVSVLREENKIYDEYVEIPVISQNKEYIIKLYPFFPPEKIKSLVISLAEFFHNAEKEKVKLEAKFEDDLVMYYIVKYFTDIKFSKSKKAKSIYDEFKSVINSKVYKEMVKLFPEQSISEVYDQIFETLDSSALLKEKFKDVQKIFNELPLQNREAFEQLNLIGKQKQITEV